MMNKRTITWLQIILYLLSPFLALALAKNTSAVDQFFLLMFTSIVLSQWLAIHLLGKIAEN